MVVITVVQVTLQRNVQQTVKCVIHVTKRAILGHIAGPDKEARAKENGRLTQLKSKQSRCDQHEVTTDRDQSDNSNWFQYKQDSVQVLFSQGICSDINSKSNIQFDE